MYGLTMIHCLIVEDAPVNWMVMQNQLAKLGVQATVCTDGQQALIHCQTQPMPALILLDGYMPGMDGISFLKILRAMPGGEKPYVLFCSSSLDKSSVDEALACGADCHFPKPIRQEHLISVLKEVMEREKTAKAGKAE